MRRPKGTGTDKEVWLRRNERGEVRFPEKRRGVAGTVGRRSAWTARGQAALCWSPALRTYTLCRGTPSPGTVTNAWSTAMVLTKLI